MHKAFIYMNKGRANEARNFFSERAGRDSAAPWN